MTAARLTMTGIHKRFGSTVALRSVDLEVRASEVHALVGENGAGKSTLMKILSGAESPDSGQMLLDGGHFAPSGPQEARRRGVAMIYQELTLAPDLSVEANMLLGLEPTRCSASSGRVSAAAGCRKRSPCWSIRRFARRVPSIVSSPAAQQLVEIARALLVEVRVLVLDEPTSSLTQADARRLFALVRRLRERGVSVVYISHYLEEVKEIADRFTVLRDGVSVGGGTVREFRVEQIIEMMVGRSLTEQFPRVPHSLGDPILEVTDLAGAHAPAGVTFQLRRGEILGIAGIVGAGRTELLRTLFGLDPVRRGEVTVRAFRGTRSTPRRRIEEGMGFLSENRKEEGLALIQSVADNLTYSRMGPYSWFGWLNPWRRRAAVQ